MWASTTLVVEYFVGLAGEIPELMDCQTMRVHQCLISIHLQLMAASGSAQSLVQAPTVPYTSPTPAWLVHRSVSTHHPVVQKCLAP